MYMRFRMQIESVMKEVTFRAELRARAWARGERAGQRALFAHGAGAGGLMGGVRTRKWGSLRINHTSLGLKKATGERWPHFPTSLMWKLRP